MHRLLARGGREWLVFAGATGVLCLHVLDDSFWHREPGVAFVHHLVPALVVLAVAAAGVVGYPFARPGIRCGLALVFGALGLVGGLIHVGHIRAESLSGSDLTGLLALVAAAVLLGLGIAVPYLHRGERGGRWRARVVAVVLGVLVVYLLVLPVGIALWVSHRYREPIADTLKVEHQDVTLRTKDGLDLAAWWVPSGSGGAGPAIIVLHGGGGDRSGAVAHAEMLARHNYSVLLWDARGRGESEGQPGALGWTWGDDVDAALDFLESKGVTSIGALGLSTGADVFLEAAAHDKRIDAVAADGATIRSVGDVLELPGAGKWTDVPYWASTYGAASLFLMARPGPRLADLVDDISPRPLLLISTGVAAERDANRVYIKAARPPRELWELPGVGHTAGLRERPQEYEARVTGFFDAALATQALPAP